MPVTHHHSSCPYGYGKDLSGNTHPKSDVIHTCPPLFMVSYQQAMSLSMEVSNEISFFMA